MPHRGQKVSHSFRQAHSARCSRRESRCVQRRDMPQYARRAAPQFKVSAAVPQFRQAYRLRTQMSRPPLP